MSRLAAASGEQPAPENLPSFLPLSPEIVDDSLGSLRRDSRLMLAFIETARLQEPADKLFVNTLVHDNNRLEHWHTENNDILTGTEFYYRLGLLYGIDMAQAARRQALLASDLTVTQPRAFAAAMTDMLQTYRGLDDSLAGWQRQKERELRYTGSDVLTLANACFDTRIQEHMYADGLPAATPDSASSMHVGLVDGVMFVAAYAVRCAGGRLAPMHTITEFVPTFDATRHSISSDPFVMQHENMGSVRAIVALALHRKLMPPGGRADDLGGVTVRELLVQTGPREFMLASEIPRADSAQ
ncbi:MAG: hypothetical protein WBP26_02990 [Candidatus Saccharimonadales bacterium]